LIKACYWRNTQCRANALRVGQVARRCPGVFQAPHQLVDQASLMVAFGHVVPLLVSLPKAGAHHPIPQLKAGQVRLAIARPRAVKIENGYQLRASLLATEEYVMAVQVLVA